ncbi:MAG TPA: hypothetical protein DCL75_07270 [Ktedonobacter sp.]|nr:hypothetical protein [Ktedonobacter sp.]
MTTKQTFRTANRRTDQACSIQANSSPVDIKFGMLENAAVLTFSLDTRIATTGITSAIASSYALVVMLFGMLMYRERLAKNQLFGIVMFMSGLILLAL